MSEKQETSKANVDEEYAWEFAGKTIAIVLGVAERDGAARAIDKLRQLWPLVATQAGAARPEYGKAAETARYQKRGVPGVKRRTSADLLRELASRAPPTTDLGSIEHSLVLAALIVGRDRAKLRDSIEAVAGAVWPASEGAAR